MTMSQILRSVTDIKRSHVKSGSLVLDVDKYGDEYEDDDHGLGGQHRFMLGGQKNSFCPRPSSTLMEHVGCYLLEVVTGKYVSQ